MTANKKTIYPQVPVEIAGAGPAGLSAAIVLAKAGLRVVVHEAHGEVGHRFGGDFQGLENWTTKEDVLSVLRGLGLTTEFMARPFCSGTAFDALGHRYEVKSKEPLFYLLERGPGIGTMDSALLSQAQSLGVEVRFNSRPRQIKGRGILAVGPRAPDAIAVGYHFETDMDDGYWLICDDELAPQGYAYLLVVEGRGTVKSCMFSGFKQEQQYVERTVEAFERLAGLKMIRPRAHGGSGNFHIPHSAYSGRHPQVGEQAGFQDTLWGFGMRLAISSGVLAAQSLLNKENYDSLWKTQLKPQMETSVVNRALFSILGNRGYSYFLYWMASSSNPRHRLQSLYMAAWYKRFLMPWAKRRYESRRKDVSCNHINCHCVWCREKHCM